jgi:hypothetical protein
MVRIKKFENFKYDEENKVVSPNLLNEMLNHESTSIARQRQEENEEYSSYDVSKIKSTKKQLTRYLIVNGEMIEVKEQKPSVYQGAYVINFNGQEFEAYTLRNLKAMIVEELEYMED